MVGKDAPARLDPKIINTTTHWSLVMPVLNLNHWDRNSIHGGEWLVVWFKRGIQNSAHASGFLRLPNFLPEPRSTLPSTALSLYDDDKHTGNQGPKLHLTTKNIEE